MEWIELSNEKPTQSGKYLVKTKTTMGNTHRLDTTCTIHDGKVHFSVTNQIVTHWLKEN